MDSHAETFGDDLWTEFNCAKCGYLIAFGDVAVRPLGFMCKKTCAVADENSRTVRQETEASCAPGVYNQGPQTDEERRAEAREEAVDAAFDVNAWLREQGVEEWGEYDEDEEDDEDDVRGPQQPAVNAGDAGFIDSIRARFGLDDDDEMVGPPPAEMAAGAAVNSGIHAEPLDGLEEPLDDLEEPPKKRRKGASGKGASGKPQPTYPTLVREPDFKEVEYSVGGRVATDEYGEVKLKKGLAGSKPTLEPKPQALAHVKTGETPEEVFAEYKLRLTAKGVREGGNKVSGPNTTLHKHVNFLRKLFEEGTFKTRSDLFAPGAEAEAARIFRAICEANRWKSNGKEQSKSVNTRAGYMMAAYTGFVELVAAQGEPQAAQATQAGESA